MNSKTSRVRPLFRAGLLRTGLVAALLCAGVSWGSGGGGTLLFAAPRSGPPVLRPLEISLDSKEPVRIRLRVAGSPLEPVTFQLRSPARFGTVRLLKQTSGEWAEVEYTPPQDVGNQVDTFFFTAVGSAGVATPMEAKIHLPAAGPRLECPRQLDFGTLRVGDSLEKELEILNRGDTRATGGISVDPPWGLDPGPSSYALAPGGSLKVRVLMNASRADVFSGELVLQGTKPVRVQLTCTVLEKLDATPDPLLLTWRDGVQRTQARITNQGPAKLAVNLRSTPPLMHPDRLEIPSRASLSVDLEWRNSTTPGWGTLSLESDAGDRRSLVWRLDAILAGLGTPIILPGNPKAPRFQRTFRNDGGRPGTWVFQTSPPFFLAEVAKPSTPENTGPETAAPIEKKADSEPVLSQGKPSTARRVALAKGTAMATVPGQPKTGMPSPNSSQKPRLLAKSLAPGESFVLEVDFEGANDRGLSGVLHITGPGVDLNEPLGIDREASRALTGSSPQLSPSPEALEEKPATRIPPKRPAPSPSAPPAGADTAFSAIFEQPKRAKPKVFLEEENLHSLDAGFLGGAFLPGFTVQDVTATSARLVFPADPQLQPGHLLVLQRRETLLETGKMEVEWIPLEGITGKRIKGALSLQLRNLQPNSVLIIRLVGPEMEDRKRHVVHQQEIHTLPEPPWHSPKSPWPYVALTLAVGAAITSRRLRNS